jgi:hypothetical protein
MFSAAFANARSVARANAPRWSIYPRPIVAADVAANITPFQITPFPFSFLHFMEKLREIAEAATPITA